MGPTLGKAGPIVLLVRRARTPDETLTARRYESMGGARPWQPSRIGEGRSLGRVARVARGRALTGRVVREGDRAGAYGLPVRLAWGGGTRSSGRGAGRPTGPAEGGPAPPLRASVVRGFVLIDQQRTAESRMGRISLPRSLAVAARSLAAVAEIANYWALAVASSCRSPGRLLAMNQGAIGVPPISSGYRCQQVLPGYRIHPRRRGATCH